MKVPIYIFRFEDALTQTSEVFDEMFRFLFGVESIEGTIIK